MVKCILSAIAGALAMFFGLLIVANFRNSQSQEFHLYEHVDYVSNITQEECFVCSDHQDMPGYRYWGKDNVGIVNLNNFDLLYLEINRYDDHGELIEEPAGYMLFDGMMDKEADSYVNVVCHPDNAYADVTITGVQYAIDRDSVENHLCQDCLDSINGQFFVDKPPAEYAIISFEERTIQALLNSETWFSAGNYGVSGSFRGDDRIDLLIHYCPNRYA